MKKITIAKTLDIDKRVVEIIEKIKASPAEVLITGGFVRDALLNIESHDYDLCTSASLETLKALFLDSEYIYHKGLKTTLKVHYKGISVEISSYRKEVYSNNFQTLKYILALEYCEDSLRRDFTINAIGYDIVGKLYDCVNGIADLKKGVIRTIGNPEIRFLEDPTRIWRALRLSSQKNLTIEKATLEAIKKHYLKAMTFSNSQQLKAILSGNNFDYVYNNVAAIFQAISNDKFQNIKIRDRNVLNNELNLLVYLYFVLKLDFNNDIFSYLNFKVKQLDFIIDNKALILKLSKPINVSELKSMYVKSKNLINQIVEIFENFDYLNPNNLKQLALFKQNLLKLSDLKINENDFSQTISKKIIYEHLKAILIKVINEEIANNRQELLAYLAKKGLVRD